MDCAMSTLCYSCCTINVVYVYYCAFILTSFVPINHQIQASSDWNCISKIEGNIVMTGVTCLYSS